ncbi:MAG: PhoH family protein [Spirochaetes bacterium]|uniref:PhoH-like protein n=1 Tax=Candidatus Gallitreponema excrementavium TaxID=2840840 RepID=A0A9D9N1I8_9SPIR|nr:PhoH family protein [Candidatus Gallitreponema excrementavium]
MGQDYTVVIKDSTVLSQICGVNDYNLKLLETYLGYPVFSRGNELTLTGARDSVCCAFRSVVDCLVTGLEKNTSVPCAEVINAFFESHSGEFPAYSSFDDSVENSRAVEDFQNSVIKIPRGLNFVYPKSRQQGLYIREMQKNQVVFGIGPAGTGKTFLAIAQALYLLLSKKCRKLVLTRPVVEAGESLGFLPGDLEQKINPYLRPLYDSMWDLIPGEIIKRLEDSGMVEIAPLAYMRGRTLKNCAIVLDEAQNTTKEQMKMFLTRLGENSFAFITGDTSQVDLPQKTQSGLINAVSILSDKKIDGISIIRLEDKDVVRSPIVRKIIKAYEQADSGK